MFGTQLKTSLEATEFIEQADLIDRGVTGGSGGDFHPRSIEIPASDFHASAHRRRIGEKADLRHLILVEHDHEGVVLRRGLLTSRHARGQGNRNGIRNRNIGRGTGGVRLDETLPGDLRARVAGRSFRRPCGVPGGDLSLQIERFITDHNARSAGGILVHGHRADGRGFLIGDDIRQRVVHQILGRDGLIEQPDAAGGDCRIRTGDSFACLKHDSGLALDHPEAFKVQIAGSRHGGTVDHDGSAAVRAVQDQSHGGTVVRIRLVGG